MNFASVKTHNSKNDCWLVIHGKVYDLTVFKETHPGGSKIIERLAGKDATSQFKMYHPPDLMDKLLEKKYHLGPVDLKTLPTLGESVQQENDKRLKLPPMASVLNMFDFENLAKQVLSPEAWGYYSSGGDDEITLRENHAAFHRIWFKPRVLVNVAKVDTRTKMFGTNVDLPVYITATALGRLGHPDGEVALTRAAGTRNIIQMMPTLASCSVDEMVSARNSRQTQWFQLYVNADRNLTKKIVLDVIKKGVKGICVTVDAPQLGRREKDMRLKFQDDAPDIRDEKEINRSSGAARAISSFIDPSLEWKDIKWLKSFTTVPLVIKGIQCGEDAILAAKAGVEGIIISNHGGRQLDTCRSAIEILEEVVDELEKQGLKDKMELYIDGGVRRGADIFKAIALGAKGVGIGRPFLYAMSCYGQSGVERAMDILKEELEMVMRLAGCPTIKDITRQHIITKDLANHAFSRDYLSDSVYEKMVPLTLAKI